MSVSGFGWTSISYSVLLIMRVFLAFLVIPASMLPNDKGLLI